MISLAPNKIKHEKNIKETPSRRKRNRTTAISVELFGYRSLR